MASGYRYQGVDFDDLFDPDVQGNGPVAGAYRRPDGQPLRYAHVQYGSRRGDVNRRQGGVDLASLWAAKGTATYTLGFNGGNYARSALALTNQQGSVNASVTLSLNSDGTWVITSFATRDGGRTEASGSWLPAGANVGDYQVQFGAATSDGGGGSVSNSAPGYQSLGAPQSVGISASAVAASTQNVDHAVHVVCYLRRISTGTVSTTSCTLRAMATGWA